MPPNENSTSGAGTISAISTRSPIGVSGGYQPALDGVRAIAVLIVIAYHLSLDGGFKIIQGGWLGVDVFFVLSGYLITALLLAEQHKRGSIHAGRFYARRFLRLAPLSIGLVVACLAIHLTGMTRHTGIDLAPRGALAILFYFANWMELLVPGSVGSMAHTWSLSIEEQFYFVWPWIVIGAIIVLRRRSRTMLIVVTTIAILAMGLARRATWLHMIDSDPTPQQLSEVWNRIYLSSFLRPDGLLVGCLAALVIHGMTITRRRRLTIRVLGLAGAVLAGYVIVRASIPQTTFWIGYTAEWGYSAQNLGVALLLVWLVVEPSSPLARLLSLRAFCWIGRRAYGLYLFNPLVIKVLTTRFELAPWQMESAALMAVTVTAGLSFRYFETPFLNLKERFSWRGGTDAHATGAADDRPILRDGVIPDA